MDINHAADAGVLENVHALDYQSLSQFKLGSQLFHLRRPGKSFENRIKVVQRVSDFVERMKEVVFELSVLGECVFFKKERDAVARIQKIFVARALLLRGLKDGRMTLIVKICGQHCRLIYKRVTLGCGIKPFKNEKPVALKLFKPFTHNMFYNNQNRKTIIVKRRRIILLRQKPRSINIDFDYGLG